MPGRSLLNAQCSPSDLDVVCSTMQWCGRNHLETYPLVDGHATSYLAWGSPLHSLRESVLADQTQGYAAHSAVLYARQVATHDLTTEKEFDVVFSRSRGESQGAQWACLRHLLLSADIWHASFCPLWPNNYDRVNQCVMRLLRLSGIKIIAYPYGTDSAGRDSCRDRFDWIVPCRETTRDGIFLSITVMSRRHQSLLSLR